VGICIYCVCSLITIADLLEEDEFQPMKVIQGELANIRAKVETFPNCTSYDRARGVIQYSVFRFLVSW
jgi:hypothetical protein